jgi:hypothetical protein
MLTQLSTVKARLGIDEFDLSSDAILTNAINAISVRFDKETNRTLTRSASITQEFSADDTEICLDSYPVESVTKFELKQNETEGWIEQTNVEYLIRRACVLSLGQALCATRLAPSVARVTYTGGFVLPGATVSAGQTPLPSDLENAAVEQVASWFQNRDKLGLTRIWFHQGTYEQFSQLDLLLNVQAVLKRYERWTL